MSDSVRPHRRKPTRLPSPWDSPGKNTGEGCHFLSNTWKWKVKGKSLSRVRLLVTPWTTAYQAPPSMGFSRQEYWSGQWVAIPFFKESSWPSDWTHFSHIAGKFFTIWATREAPHQYIFFNSIIILLSLNLPFLFLTVWFSKTTNLFFFFFYVGHF